MRNKPWYMRRLAVVLLTVLSLGSVGHSQVISNFESSAGYAAGADIGGVDGWTSFGGVKGTVMPDPISGYNTVLEGSQSYVIYSNAAAYGRRFGSASGAVTDGAVISWLMGFEVDYTGGASSLYLSNNVGAGQTPAGIQANDTTNQFELFGLGGTIASSVGFAHNTTYRLEMELDFVNDRFEGFATDLTNVGSRTSLGTAYFGTALNASTVGSGGGVVLTKTGGSASYWDGIEITSRSTPVEDAPRSGFGRQWVRNNPLTVSGVPTSQANWDDAGGLPTYMAAGMNTVWAYGFDTYPMDEAVPAGVPVHAYLSAENPSAAVQQFNAVRNIGSPMAWMIGDEPSRAQMDNAKLVADYVKQNDPDALRYVNAFPAYATKAQLWGDASNPAYEYEQYVQDIMTITKPDVLMYDLYPFNTGGTDYNAYFYNMQVIRQEALNHDVPYWAWMQSWSAPGTRLPSESDVRMQVFSHLAAGFTGISYWTYDKRAEQTNALLDANNDPTSLYYAAAEANAEAENLGKALRFLSSTDLRFVAGQTGGSSNATPGGLASWSIGAGEDVHLLDVSILGANGATQNGLLGFFEADDGQVAFMLANLHHGDGLLAEDTSLTFLLEFDESINELLMFNRMTGLQELLTLSNHTLTVTLPGGTGNLYKYNTGDFVVAVPEPSMLGIASLSALLLARRRVARRVSGFCEPCDGCRSNAVATS